MSTKFDHHFKDACAAWDSGNLSRAFKLFSQAAAAGDASCQINLGYFYGCGLHMAPDRGLALHWYRQAYRQGEASAVSNIATIYRDTPDYGRMIWWWRAAAGMGDGDALLDIGRCYEKGRGVRRDRERARACYVQLLASPLTTEASREMAESRLRQLQRRSQNPRRIERHRGGSL